MKYFSPIVMILILWGQLSIAQPQTDWTQFFDHQEKNDGLLDVYVTDQQSYVACGYASEIVLDNNTRSGFWFVETTMDGDTLDQQAYFQGDDDQDDWAYTIIQLDNGGYAMGGYVQHTVDGIRKFSVLRISREGQIVWWNEYCEENNFRGICYAIIETKGGNILAVGQCQANTSAYAVMIRADGEVIWERYYEQSVWYAAREIAEEGYLFSGPPGLYKINDQGEIVQQVEMDNGPGRYRDFVSLAGGGWATLGLPTGPMERTAWISRFNVDLEHQWTTDFVFDEEIYWDIIFDGKAGGITRTPSDEIIMVGTLMNMGLRIYTPFIWKVDANGNDVWLRYDHNVPENGAREDYTSIVVGPDDAPVIVGKSYVEAQHSDGVMVKLVPDESPPNIINYFPQEEELTILQGDTILFGIEVFDWQDDDLTYRWMKDDEQIGGETDIQVVFEDLGEFVITGVVSDETGADSVMWNVHVTDMYITSYIPEQPIISIRRGESINFQIEVRATNGGDVNYKWVFRDEVISDSSVANVLFDHPGDYSVTAMAYRDESEDSVSWNIDVHSVFGAFWPEEFELTISSDTTIWFIVEPFNPNSDSLRYIWLRDGEETEDTTAEVECNFTEFGEYSVAVHAYDGMEGDTILWHIIYPEPDEVDGGIGIPPYEFGLSAFPNPFNSQTSVNYSLPVQTTVSLNVYDINGRFVKLLQSGLQTAAKHSLVWDSGSLTTGVYILVLNSDDFRLVRKIIFIK